MSNSSKNMPLQGSLSIFFCAIIYGVFWIPLRYFDESGLNALWAVAAINFTGCLVGIPFAIWLKEFRRDQIKWIVIIGLGMGISNVLYFTGIIISDVVRVIFLFYLLPLWATLFSWLIFRIPIGKTKTIALLVAVIGIWLLLGAGGWPIPQDLGHVFGLLAGMAWAFGLTMIRGRSDLGAFATTASALAFACVAALIMGAILTTVTPEIQPPFPGVDVLQNMTIPVLAFGIIILWPSFLGQMWGAKFVAATTAALLTMSEIMAATFSSALLDETDLSFISWVGASLILAAVLIDIFASQHD